MLVAGKCAESSLIEQYLSRLLLAALYSYIINRKHWKSRLKGGVAMGTSAREICGEMVFGASSSLALADTAVVPPYVGG